jgi:TonB family protein
MRLAFGIGALLLGISFASAAQSTAPQGSISGVVLDAATEKPIEGAVVTVRSAALVGEQSASTDGNGYFEVTMLPSGVYGLTVARDGYQTFEPGGLDVKSKRMRLKLQLVATEKAAPKAEAPSAAAVPPAPEFDAATMTAPVMLSGPAPEYTAEAMERGVEGTMVLRCVVLTDGSVRGCAVRQGLPFMNRACIDALQARKYKPAMQAGKPVDVTYTFTIRLKLPTAERERLR